MTRPAGRRAAQQARQRHDLCITLPGLGTIDLGPPEQLAYLAGITALAAGHVLADQRRSATLHAFGEALEQA